MGILTLNIIIKIMLFGLIPEFSCGQAAAIVLSVSFINKLIMTAAFRATATDKATNRSFIHQSKIQLNDAEWAPFFAAPLFFMHSQNVDNVTGNQLIVIGVVLYSLLPSIIKDNNLKVPGGLARYIGTGVTLYNLYHHLF